MDINDQLNKGGKHRHMNSTIITREKERERDIYKHNRVYKF